MSVNLSDALSKRLLPEEEAADLLGVRKQTLAVWRSTRRYDLPFIKVGRSVRYRLSDIEAFLASRTVGSVPVSTR